MAVYSDDTQVKATERFLSLDYKPIPIWKKIYFMMRTGEKYDLISSKETSPVYEDRDQIKSFMENNVIEDNDIMIFKQRGKTYFVIRNESILNAMRICS